MPTKEKNRTAAKQSAANRTTYAAARRKASVEATEEEELITDPETIKSIECGLADLKTGRVKPWKEVKRNV